MFFFRFNKYVSLKYPIRDCNFWTNISFLTLMIPILSGLRITLITLRTHAQVNCYFFSNILASFLFDKQIENKNHKKKYCSQMFRLQEGALVFN